MRVKLLPICILVFVSSCQSSTENMEASQQAIEHVPQWAQEAIWYQIFVERFRNGDPSNDPTPADMKGGDPEFIPTSWSVTPWVQDWYVREPWQNDMKVKGFYHRIQARRYGGDLQGVLDKLDYLKDLGVTAIYFNPLNDSPSLHKFDARNWRHIDRNFGPDPKGDVVAMADEVPDDPSTWHWTAGDKLFLKVVDELHQRGIRVIMDYSWNHTGPDFWAFHDLEEKGAQSKYKEWYKVKSFDDPNTPEDEFEYEGWGGYKFMPVVNKRIVPPTDSVMPFEGNLVSESLKQHIFNISKRWLDPNNDGDPSDGVDGFRLDVAAEVPMGFWREYRKVVREVNPDALIIGEVWWLDWPSTLLDPRVFLGDQFDAIMNYRWYRIARSFFGQPADALTPTQFVEMMRDINKDIKPGFLRAMMNMSASHDTPRLATSLYNKNKYKYRPKPNDDPVYKIDQPDARTRQIQKMLLVHQFTFIGSPQIWNGDEVGMWGADDPDCRKPMVWDDLEYKVEKATYNEDQPREPDTVRPDEDLLKFYKKLILLRKENPVLSAGDLEFIHADDSAITVAYTRKLPETEALVVFNRSERAQEMRLAGKGQQWETLLSSSGASYQLGEADLTIELPALGYLVLQRNR